MPPFGQVEEFIPMGFVDGVLKKKWKNEFNQGQYVQEPIVFMHALKIYHGNTQVSVINSLFIIENLIRWMIWKVTSCL